MCHAVCSSCGARAPGASVSPHAARRERSSLLPVDFLFGLEVAFVGFRGTDTPYPKGGEKKENILELSP